MNDFNICSWYLILQEETRQKLVASDNKIRQLEAQVCEEQLASANGRKVILPPY